MKKIFLFLYILIFSNLFIQAQVNSFSGLDYKGNYYDITVIKIDTETVDDFQILENKNASPHKDFYASQVYDKNYLLINASSADAACNPPGLFIKNSQEIQPINTGTGEGNFYLKPNGAFIVTKEEAIVCETSNINSYKSKAIMAIQSGPMLVNSGSINSNFDANSKNRNMRSGVGSGKNSQGEKCIVFITSTSLVTFHQLASIFKDRFNCENALCLENSGCVMNIPYIESNTAKSLKDNLKICNYIYFGVK